jgi:hypothetical protein
VAFNIINQTKIENTFDLNNLSYISMTLGGGSPVSSINEKTHFVFNPSSQLLCSKYLIRKAEKIYNIK